MNEQTKAKINVKDGFIELEGSEEFVQKNLDEFKRLINLKSEALLQNKRTISSEGVEKSLSKKKNHRGVKKGVNILPIPLDFKSNSKNLKDFFKDKFPNGSQNNQEITTLFIYYLNKILSIQEAVPGHVVSCYNEMGIKKPLNIPQLFRDISSLKGWIESSKTPGSVKITISGENLIQHDLPREVKKKIKNNGNQKFYYYY